MPRDLGETTDTSASLLSERAELPLPAAPPRPRPTLRREWLLLLLSLLLLVGIVAPPLINLGRYQHRIVDAMSRSLGRPVSMRAVTLRLLPSPALVLSDVVVNEEPGFGAEPALRAPTMTAELRLSSLWRGRFEVSRAAISEASVNLVRTQDGRWNIGSILLQASHVNNAPTAQRRAGPTPRFPYIEISDSRINIKRGMEKLPYSLLNANISMWLAEPDVWQVRLDAQPVRTDLALGLSDTGLIRVEGRLHRASNLDHMPLALHADWSGAPLGQAGRLLLGQDHGWRGDLHATADVTGELEALTIESHLLIANLHRQEFTPAEPFPVDATCRGVFGRADASLRNLACRWPIGRGQLLLRGELTGGGTGQHLQLEAEHLPASFLLAGVGLARSDLAPPFRLEGEFAGEMEYSRENERTPPSYAGVLGASLLQVVAPQLREPLALAGVKLTAGNAAGTDAPLLVLTADPLVLAEDAAPATHVTVRAQVGPAGILLHAGGGGGVPRLLEAAQAIHVTPVAMARLLPQGTADFDLTRTILWQPPDGAAGSGLGGWLRLRNVAYAPPFLPAPVTIPLAEATFAPGQLVWNIPAASFHRLPLQLAATVPLTCAGRASCPTEFSASFAALDAAELSAALLGSDGDGPLLDRLLRRMGGSRVQWPALEGSVHADSFSLGRLLMRQANARLTIEGTEARLLGLEGRALGGVLRGDGRMAIEDGKAHFAVHTTLEGGSAGAAGNLLRENWGPGTLNATAQVELAGLSAAELLPSVHGTFHAEWTRGALGTNATPLGRFARWSADGTIKDQQLQLTGGQLLATPAAGPRPVAGTIGFDRTLDLRTGFPPPLTLTGTLAHPEVAPPANH